MLKYNQTLDFYKFCDILYQEWTLGHLEDDKILQKLFELDCPPTPCIVYKNGKKPLYMLINKPSTGMGLPDSEIGNYSSYTEFAINALNILNSENIEKINKTKNEAKRIMQSIDFANSIGFDALVRIEANPFFSKQLNKSIALDATGKSWTLYSYENALKNFLMEKPVMLVSSCSTKETISKNTFLKNKWLVYQCELANFDIEKLKIKPLTTKNNKITSALFIHQNKYLILMMGSNILPKINKT